MNEPWKDSGDAPERAGSPGDFFQRMLGVTPPTPEQRAQWKQDLAAAVAIGELVYPTLPRFQPARACVKCGGAKRKASFFRRTVEIDIARQVGAHEFLLVVCRRCGFDWVERPLDDETGAEDTR